MRVNYFTIVWGSEYIKKFCLYTLPSIISQNNIKSLVKQKYYIYTESSEEFLRYPILRNLQEICEVIFLGVIGGNRDSILIESTKDAVKRAFEDKAILKIIPPETVYSDGSLTNMLKKIEEGYDAVIFPFGGLRVSEKDFILDENKDNLVQTFFRNIHKETLLHYTNSKNFIPGPVMKINEKNKVNSFYHQPSYMKINRIADFNNLELDFVNSLVDVDKVYAVKDSNEAFEVSLTPDKYFGWGENEYNEKDFLDFNINNINPVSKLSFEQGFAIV